MRQVVEERRCFHRKSPLFSWGERPRWPCNAVRGDKRTGEVNRVLPGNHKLAEPVEVGRTGTSAPVSGPARESATERETEPMVEVPLEDVAHRRGSGWVDRKIGGVLASAGDAEAGAGRETVRQPLSEPAGLMGPNPHGIESAPTADERMMVEPENLAPASPNILLWKEEMTEATGDRDSKGRSLRSSPRARKPLTWRREAVGAASRQEVDTCPAR